MLVLAGLSWAGSADDLPFQHFQCDAGVRFNLRLLQSDRLELKINGRVIFLPQVAADIGNRYSDGQTTIWLKGDSVELEQGNLTRKDQCHMIASGEPLTPIRDAASGVIFIPPTRWTAGKVQLTAQSGDELAQSDAGAAVKFQYRYWDTSHQTAYPLLSLLVFDKTERKLDFPGDGIPLGEDARRVFLARLPTESPIDADNDISKMFADLQISEEELKQAFSLYGVVANNRVETVSANIRWLDKALYPGAVLTVELLNVSRMDAPAEVVARKVIKLENGAPQTVTLNFAPEAINPKYRYTVTVRLEQDGKLIKISNSHNAVLTQGATRDVEVVLRSAEN